MTWHDVASSDLKCTDSTTGVELYTRHRILSPLPLGLSVGCSSECDIKCARPATTHCNTDRPASIDKESARHVTYTGGARGKLAYRYVMIVPPICAANVWPSTSRQREANHTRDLFPPVVGACGADSACCQSGVAQPCGLQARWSFTGR